MISTSMEILSIQKWMSQKNQGNIYNIYVANNDTRLEKLLVLMVVEYKFGR